MELRKLDGNLFNKMIIAGANALYKNKDLVDGLNVFPVPDGDTGTNMSLTFLAAAKEAEKINSPNIYDIAKGVSSGSLRGARGNSGVILSQLFRGFAKGLEGCDVATTEDIASSFMKATEMAYKAVMKPKEGTILTVAKALGEKAAEIATQTDDLEVLFSEVLEYGQEMLVKTTDMLPQLKQVGVVDAGGKGLLIIWEAAFEQMKNNVDITLIDPSNSETSEKQHSNIFESMATEDIVFGYCTEFFICKENANEENEKFLKNYLSTIGDSIVVVADDNIIKIHVHTDTPGKALEKGLSIGYLDNIKIENMRIQHTNNINFSQKQKDETIPKKDVGFIAVSAGEGFKELFINLGVDIVVSGGQTMNPSTEDFIDGINKVNAESIIILPNNKNIILAAQQAGEIVTDKKIFVLESKSIPEGVSALINFDETLSPEESFEEMKEVLNSVSTGQITYAVRDTVLDGESIKEGDILCMLNGKIEFTSKTIQQGSKSLLDLMVKKGGEVVSIFYGESTTEEMANELADYVADKYSEVEVEVHNGGQPIYHYIFSIE